MTQNLTHKEEIDEETKVNESNSSEEEKDEETSLNKDISTSVEVSKTDLSIVPFINASLDL